MGLKRLVFHYIIFHFNLINYKIFCKYNTNCTRRFYTRKIFAEMHTKFYFVFINMITLIIVIIRRWQTYINRAERLEIPLRSYNNGFETCRDIEYLKAILTHPSYKLSPKWNNANLYSTTYSLVFIHQFAKHHKNQNFTPKITIISVFILNIFDPTMDINWFQYAICYQILEFRATDYPVMGCYVV